MNAGQEVVRANLRKAVAPTLAGEIIITIARPTIVHGGGEVRELVSLARHCHLLKVCLTPFWADVPRFLHAEQSHDAELVGKLRAFIFRRNGET
jgi:hypothetical protein